MQLWFFYRSDEKGLDVGIFASLLKRVCIGVECDHSGIPGDRVILNGLNQLRSAHSRHFHVDNGHGVAVFSRNCLA